MQIQTIISADVRPLANVKALLFDLDDTLYDRGATFYRWANAFIQSYLPASEHDAALALLCTLDAQGMAPRTALFSSFQLSYPGLYEVGTLIEMYYQQFPAYMEYAHLESLLSVISQLHMPIGIVTNGFIRQQQPKIATLGLDTITSCIFISERFGAEKPSASLFRAAAAKLQVPMEQILFVGDNPTVDIYGANQVGMKTLWIHHGAEWPAQIPFCADLTLQTIAELPALLVRHHAAMSSASH